MFVYTFSGNAALASAKYISTLNMCIIGKFLEFYVFCALHCNIIIQYKLTKCTFSELI